MIGTIRNYGHEHNDMACDKRAILAPYDVNLLTELQHGCFSFTTSLVAALI